MEYQDKINSICDILKSGEKPPTNHKIGVEFEHIIVEKNSFKSINYYQDEGIETILKKMLPKGYTPKYENSNLLGLENHIGAITLEPGGQLELSVKSCMDIKEIEEYYMKFLGDIIPILEEQKQLLMAIGYHPKTRIKDIPFNPKKRYQYMSNYFEGRGKYPHNMMKGTASLQVVIDYRNEEDFIRKYKVANLLSPLLSLASDNAPVFEGEIFNKNSIRSIIWDNTDSKRGGLLAGAMDKDFGYKKYAEYILNTPPIFIIKDNQLILTNDLKTEDLMDMYDLTTAEIEHIMSMVFPDVRPRKYIELRMGDSLPYPLNLGYVALIKGLFYNEDSLNYLYSLAEETDDQQLGAYRRNVIDKGFNGMFRGKRINEVLPLIVDLAKKGLGKEEKAYLDAIEEMVLQFKNPAIISKELIKENGIQALEWCGLNQWVGRNSNGSKGVI
ncbi:glutamate--cysteine ligase [Alkaliphilus pronyensis]|uniref:Glutamate--cysteine ligase n=1 Tax=Alkaliphilus pronyensis TaxID=1482732 RepID=A0A6I0FXR0_9FIRM|nr:glutamate-cysteine ligase family protein [Alkaliphilus pronyensis]KAB3540984.1 glutamate--cysteine ligase [Alkaliphilus pronyensis]